MSLANPCRKKRKSYLILLLALMVALWVFSPDAIANDYFFAQRSGSSETDPQPQGASQNIWTWVTGFIALCILAGFLYYQKFRAAKAYLAELEHQNFLIKEQKEEI